MSRISVQFGTEPTPENSGPSTIADAIQLQAALHPKRPAIIASHLEPFSFHDLSEHIRRVGDLLRAAGIGSSSRVGIAVPNGPEAAILGVSIAANAISVLINLKLTKRELDEELDRLCLDAVILPNWIETVVSSAVRDRSLGVFHVTQAVESLSTVALRQVRDVPALTRKSGIPSSVSTALVMRSSGTTGATKYIRNTHGNLLEVAAKLQRWFALSGTDRSALLTPAYYAGGIKVSILSSLMLGGGVTIPSPRPEHLAKWIFDLQPTWFYANPTLAQSILERSIRGEYDGHSLRFVAVSSGVLADTLRTKLESMLRVPVLEFYALSEAGVMAANPVPPATRKPGTVGLISPGEVAIQDAHGGFLEAGVVGEIMVRGPSVFPGYLDDPELDSATSEEKHDRWLPTGDLGIIDNDGFLTLAGRKKDVINRGGEKIAPYEIEKALLSHPAVREAVAFGVPHPRLGENVTAAVVLEPETDVTSSELQSFLYERLASFKIPQHIYVTSTLPRTATNKVRTSELREYFSNRVRQLVPPHGYLEELILDIWKQVLGRTDIGVTENFFELGGDSLLAAAMLADVEALARQEVPQSALQAVLTVRQLAVAILRDPVEQEFITLAKDGSGVPFFFCHADDANRGAYALRLANLMDQDLPLFLLNPHQGCGDAGQVPMEDLARLYVPHLLATQPTGQFRIGGYCVGGLLAWEIAYQLAQAGREVELLVLIDTPSLNGYIAFRTAKKLVNLFALISPIRTREKIRLKGMVFIWSWARRIMGKHPIVERVKRRFVRDGFKNLSFSALPTVPDSQWMDHYRRMANYLPPFLDTELFHIVCEESAGRLDFSPSAWTHLARAVHSKRIPGSHVTCVTTLAGKLANELQGIFSTRHLDFS